MVDFKKLLATKKTVVISVDFETRSTTDLPKTGVYPYARHRLTDIWCMAWTVDEEEDIGLWRMGEPFPPSLAKLMADPNVVIEWRAWNANFERLIWKEIAAKRYGWPAVPDELWVDTAAEAAAMGLPRGLDQCAAVVGVKHKKDRDGYALMMKLTKPRKWEPDTMREPIWWTETAMHDRLGAYCQQDVRAERDLKGALHRLPPNERRAYLLDQQINDRGIKIDRPLILAAQVIVDEGVDRADTVLEQLTDGNVTSVGQTKKLSEWLTYQGVETKSVAKDAVRDMLESDLDPAVRSVLTARAAAGRTSNTKLKAMLACACVEDDRMRGLLLYHGAGTGRWTGKLAQPHNFPKGDVPNVEFYLEDLLAKAYETLELYANPIAIVSSALRSMIVAADGHDFIGADYSAIEARVLNWIADQKDMVELFRRYDASKTDAEKWANDPYVRNASKLYSLTIEKVKKFPHRHTGKFQELGCGYQMGWKTAIVQGKKQYEIDMTPEFAKEVVKGYRDTHPANVALWKSSNDAAKEATRNPGAVIVFGPHRNLKFTVRGTYLYLVLPSKRALVYSSPKMERVKTPWIVEEEEASGMKSDPTTWPEAVVVWGTDSQTKRWVKYALYGGLIVENIVQALARDIMLFGMFGLEDRKYPVVLTVHDEIVTEVAEDFGTVTEVEDTMRIVPDWAAGCPINAEGWRGKRYRK